MNKIATQKNAGSKVAGLLGLFAGCMVGMLSIQSAHAADGEDVPTLVVKFDARSLATDEGVQALHRKLENAARLVCHDDGTPQDVSRAVAAHRCSEASLARAVRDINDPRLAQSVTRRAPRAG